jgi:hypothetical protein
MEGDLAMLGPALAGHRLVADRRSLFASALREMMIYKICKLFLSDTICGGMNYYM